jgi:hypothetical protein
MNKIVLIGLAIFSFSCSQTTESSSGSDQEELIRIDTVRVESIHRNDICFVIEESKIPKVTGISDEIFEKQINDIFTQNFNDYMEYQIKSSDCSAFEDVAEDSPLNNHPTAFGTFKVLSKNDDFISVCQTFVRTPGGSANQLSHGFKVINCDIKGRAILNNKDLNVNFNRDFLNSKLKVYFYNLYPPLAEMGDDFELKLLYGDSYLHKLNYGVKNDSIYLIIEAEPYAHSSHGIYEIPIDKWKRNE